MAWGNLLGFADDPGIYYVIFHMSDTFTPPILIFILFL